MKGVVPWRDLDVFLLDLDGVVYLGGAAIPGAPEAVATLRGAGKALRFLTNDPRFSADELAAKLRGLGVAADPGEIVTSGGALARHLRRAGLTSRTAYVVGTPALKGEMAAAGLILLEGEAARRAQVVVVGGSDIAGGKQAGCVTILVLSGSTRAEDLAASAIKPDFVLASLAALVSGGSGPSATR